MHLYALHAETTTTNMLLIYLPIDDIYRKLFHEKSTSHSLQRSISWRNFTASSINTLIAFKRTNTQNNIKIPKKE